MRYGLTEKQANCFYQISMAIEEKGLVPTLEELRKLLDVKYSQTMQTLT